MAIVTNTFTTYSAKGIREDLSNVITNIAPEETPFMSNIGRENVTNTLYEWQTDTLAAAAANAQLEGDDVTSFDSVTATVRLQNYAQISRKTIVLSNTEEVVNKAGRRSEVAYQIAKRSSELKRDQEFAMLNNAGTTSGSTTAARTSASLQAFIKTNVDYDTTNGVNPTYTTLPTLGRTQECDSEGLDSRRHAQNLDDRPGQQAACFWLCRYRFFAFQHRRRCAPCHHHWCCRHLCVGFRQRASGPQPLPARA